MHEIVKALVWNIEWRRADVPTCFDGVGELAVNPVVLVERCHLYDGGAYRGQLVGHGIVHVAGEVGYVIVGVLHRHQDASQVTVKWELLILDLRTNEGVVEAAGEVHCFLRCGSTELFLDFRWAAVCIPGLFLQALPFHTARLSTSLCFEGFFVVSNYPIPLFFFLHLCDMSTKNLFLSLLCCYYYYAIIYVIIGQGHYHCEYKRSSHIKRTHILPIVRFFFVTDFFGKV